MIETKEECWGEKDQDRDIESREQRTGKDSRNPRRGPMQTAGEHRIDKDKKAKGEGEEKREERGGKRGKMEGEDRWFSADLRSVLGNARSPGD